MVRQPTVDGIYQVAGVRAIEAARREALLKSRKHLDENVRAADIVLTADDLAAVDDIVPPGAAFGTRYAGGQMDRLNR